MNRHLPRCIHKYGLMDDKYGKDILIPVGMTSSGYLIQIFMKRMGGFRRGMVLDDVGPRS